MYLKYIVHHMTSPDTLQVNYHNIFGHMRDLYEVHEKFWNTTLLPCLQKVSSLMHFEQVHLAIIIH